MKKIHFILLWGIIFSSVITAKTKEEQEQQKQNSEKQEKAQTAPETKKNQLEVNIRLTKAKELYNPVYYTGSISPAESYSIYPETTGIIEKIFHKPGKYIKQGQKLFIIRPQKYNIGFKKNLITAEASGQIIYSYFKPGDLVTPNNKLLEVQTKKSLILQAKADFEDLKHLKIDTELRVLLKKDTYITAVVNHINPAINKKSQSLDFEAKINCEKCVQVVPGMFVTAMLPTAKRQRITVPLNVLEGFKKVPIIVDGTVEWREVELGEFFGQEAEVIKGLNENEQLITAYSRSPKDGETAKINKVNQ